MSINLLEEKGVAVHRKLYCNSPFSHQSQGLDPNKPSLQILGPEKSPTNIKYQHPDPKNIMKTKSTHINKRERKRGTYESISLGFARGLIGDDDSLEDLTKLLEIPPHLFCRGLPSQPTNEDFCKSCVSEL